MAYHVVRGCKKNGGRLYLSEIWQVVSIALQAAGRYIEKMIAANGMNYYVPILHDNAQCNE